MSKKMKPFAHLIVLTILISIPSSATAQSPKPSAVPAEMTVREAHSVLASPSTTAAKDLMRKTIALRAMVLEQVQVRTMNPDVTRCSNHLILVDPDPELQKRFHALRWDARAPFLRTIPHVVTTEVTPGGEGGSALPTKAGLYRGRFVATDCREAAVRFKIEAKVKELPVEPEKPSVPPSASPSPGR